MATARGKRKNTSATTTRQSPFLPPAGEDQDEQATGGSAQHGQTGPEKGASASMDVPVKPAEEDELYESLVNEIERLRATNKELENETQMLRRRVGDGKAELHPLISEEERQSLQNATPQAREEIMSRVLVFEAVDINPKQAVVQFQRRIVLAEDQGWRLQSIGERVEYSVKDLVQGLYNKIAQEGIENVLAPFDPSFAVKISIEIGKV